MGKMIILIVLGTYFIIASIMVNNNNITSDSVENSLNYYITANAKHIASSGANMAVSRIMDDINWKGGYTNKNFSEGKLNVSLIPDASLGEGGVRIVSTGTYMDEIDTAIVEMNLISFNNYIYFADEMPANGWFVTGTVFDGPVHTNGRVNIDGKPIFKGKLTMGTGPMNLRPGSKPVFEKGYEYVEKIPMPGNLDNMKSTAQSGGFYTSQEMDLVLNNNSTVNYRLKSGSSWGSWKNNVALSTLTPNGLIFSDNNIHVTGKIAGSLTVSTSKSILIEDDIGVSDDPRTNPNSNQYLGLTAQADIIIQDNGSSTQNFEIVAACYAGNSLYAENYDSRPVGTLKIYGSVIQKKAGFMGTFDSKTGKIKTGFSPERTYDQRFRTNKPPYFPVTNKMQILSWWE